MSNKTSEYTPPNPEALERAFAALKAVAVNGYAPGTWGEELALCEKERVAKLWSELRGEKARQSKRRYNERHPERVRAMRPIYQAR
jgi:hypothetical protein